MIIKTGDAVLIEADGRKVPGYVAMASPNGRSLFLQFEALLHGHLGSMPVLQDERSGESFLPDRQAPHQNPARFPGLNFQDQ